MQNVWQFPVHIAQWKKIKKERQEESDTEVERLEGGRYGEDEHAILITLCSRFCTAEWFALTHAWHQSSPTWAPEEPSAMQKWGHIFQHQCPTVYRQAYTNTHPHTHTKTHRERVAPTSTECPMYISHLEQTECFNSSSCKIKIK